MDLGTIVAAIEADPFRPFEIELVSGNRVRVDHPENAFVLPSRQKIDRIEVFHPDTGRWTFVYVEGIAAMHLERNGREEA